MKWQDIIQLNDDQLLEKGITTFAVRSELLYYFNIIKESKVILISILLCFFLKLINLTVLMIG